MDGPISQIHRNSLIIKGENIILRTILAPLMDGFKKIGVQERFIFKKKILFFVIYYLRAALNRER